MVQECIEWKQGKKCASQVHHKFVALGRALVQRSPKRSTKVLDANLNVVSYEKMAYAADFNDNPAGDFLKNINLDDPGSLNGTGLKPSSTPKDAIPLLDMFLECIWMLTDIPLVNALLYKAGALSLCESLSELVHRKTGGFILFCTNFLKSLHEEGMLRFSMSSRKWEYSLNDIRQRKIEADVVKHLSERMARLPNNVQSLLKISACLGK